MIYIYSGAYKPLLFAAALKNKGEDITIITNNTDVEKYCETEHIPCYSIPFIRPKVHRLYKMIAIKKHLDSIIQQIQFNRNDQFYIISSRTKCYEGFYLAKELSKAGKVIYKDPHDRVLQLYIPKKTKPIFFRGFIMKQFLRYVYGLDVVYYEVNNTILLGIDDRFLQRHHIALYEPNEEYNKIAFEGIQQSKRNYKAYDGLIIDGGPLEQQITRESIDTVFEQLLELPVEFAFKKHPSKAKKHHMDYYNLFTQCEEIPSYMPIELFYNNINKHVIAIYSASLVTASQLPHIQAISLLELVDFYNESFKKEMREYLVKMSDNKISFPTSIEELKTIIMN